MLYLFAMSRTVFLSCMLVLFSKSVNTLCVFVLYMFSLVGNKFFLKSYKLTMWN